ncbi:MAG: LUD domain-containing protein, partial [Oscillospiraceae bacterium]|nr:LUD domain-containing protein [Oscillospiraceae bacterium]
MDKNVAFTEEKRAQRTMENLRKNRMEAYFVKTSAEAAELVKSLIPEGSVCRVGGSVTLHETGIISLLENGNYDYRDSHTVPAEEVE